MAVGAIGLNPEYFWNTTPREFGFIFDAYQKKTDEHVQLSWEQTRMMIYYLYCGIPKKNRNPSYNTFKSKHIPFPWDKVNSTVDDDIDTIEQQEQLEKNKVTPTDWLNRIQNLNSSGSVEKKLDLNDMEQVKNLL